MQTHSEAVESWSQGRPGQTLVQDRKGFIPTARNVARAIATPGWWRQLGHDVFRDEVMWCPWRGGDAGEWRAWRDSDYMRCRVQLEKDGFAPVSREIAREAVLLVVEDHEFDTALLWLNRRPAWDRAARVARWLVDYCGAADTPYNRSVALYFWTGLIARLVAPGSKTDMVMVLVGPPGVRKSTMVATIPPDPIFSVRLDLRHDDVENARKMRGAFTYEIAELRGMRGRESEALKDFLSGVSDKFTRKYSEFAKQLDRRGMFIGTTDDDSFLQDAAGNLRRWLPVRVTAMDLEGMKRDRDQIFAEAFELYLQNGVMWEDAERLAGAEHGDFEVEDSWGDTLQQWMHTDAPSESVAVNGRAGSWLEAGFTVREALIYGLGFEAKLINRAAEMRVATALKTIGLRRIRPPHSGKGARPRVWSI